MCSNFLKKNGRGCCTVVDAKECERLIAECKLKKALEEGEQSAKVAGWLSAAEVLAKILDI